jgi:glucose-1-phosphatase
MIRNIIFDMGNVIIDIDVPETYRAFAAFAGISEEEATAIFNDNNFYYNLEVGKIDDQTFRHHVRGAFGAGLTDFEIDKAWCALLKEMPKDRLDRILELTKSYNVFLLSNTNAIHIREVSERAALLGHDFLALFKIPFLSYEMGLMKPDENFYHEVLRKGDLLPEETIFIDDNFDNIESAGKVGIETIWLNPLGTVLNKLEKF